MSKKIIHLENEAFHRKLLQTTTLDEFVICCENYLGESLEDVEVCFNSFEVIKHFSKLRKEKKGFGALITLPDGRKGVISAHPPSKLKKQ